MSLISTVTMTRSVSPISRCSWRSLSASPPGSSRDSVSPCSSRSTMAWCSRRRRCSAPELPADTPSASLTKTASTSASMASGAVRRATAMALIGLPSATMLSSSSSARVRPPGETTGADQRLDDRGVQRGAAGGHRADRIHQLVSLGHVVLEQVAVAGRALGQQRDGVLGVLVLGQDHDPGPRVPLAQLLRRVDALPLERRRHPDVGHEHLRVGGGRAVHQLVVVGGHAHHGQVGVPLDEGAHALADDQVVVREKDRDRAGRSRVTVIHVTSLVTPGRLPPVGRHAGRRW